MNLFKKITIFTLTALVAFSCACTGQSATYTIFGGSFWLNSPEITDVRNVNETCVYGIALTPAENSAFTVEYANDNRLKTTLSTVSENGKPYYSFKTELTVKGNYKYGDKVIPIDDSVVSECVFSGTDKQFFPLRSSKSVTSTTVESYNGSVQFSFFSYNQTTEYSDGAATVKITKNKAMPETLKELVIERAVKESENTYDKLGSTYIDNELTFFFPRAAELTSGFSAQYSSLDVLAKKVRKLSLSVNSEKGTQEIKLPEYSYNGSIIKDKTIACFIAQIAITGDSFTGTPQTLYFAAGGTRNENKRRLVKIETTLPYLAGTVTYTLRSVTYNA